MNETEIKKQEAIKELSIWFASTNCKSLYYDEPLSTIQNNLQEAKLKKSTRLSFESIELWYSNNFVYHGLTDKTPLNPAMPATYGYFAVELTSLMAKSYPDNPPNLDFHKTAYYLANVLIQRWESQTDKMLEWIVNGLPTKLLKGGQDFKVAAWFIINLACKVFVHNLTTEKYNYPSDMGVYQQVLDRWDTQDINEVDKMVSELCDYHLTQATFGDGRNVMGIQFNSAAEFVYAYEILAWLSLREMSKLQNPAAYTHPLMQLPINRLQKVITPYNTTELYERVLSRVNEEIKS
ncbi:MAG: hypothetical protein J2P21_27665 [Chloracidobacterium sp.]|nr:hypothetical protein [Chloracidobacterium sp.]